MTTVKTPALIATALLALTVGCGDDDDSAPPVATFETPTTEEGELPTAEVVFMNAGQEEFPVLRFAAEITNPADEPREGVMTAWKALDADGVIIGSYENPDPIPVIPPGDSVYYVGGAALDDVAAEVQVEITDPGALSQGAGSGEDSVVTADNVTFEKNPDESTGVCYDVSYTLVANEDVEDTETIVGSVLLRDAAGEIVGADFVGLELGLTVPPQLSAGERAKVSASCVPVTGEPASAEVSLWLSDFGVPVGE